MNDRRAHAALVVAAVLFWPITLCVLAYRGTRALIRDARSVGWEAVTARRLLWAALVTDLVVLGAIPSPPHAQVADVASTLVLLAAIAGLIVDGVRRRARRDGLKLVGSDGKPATRLRDMVEHNSGRLEELEAAQAAQRADHAALADKFDGLRTGLVSAFGAAGREAPAELDSPADDETRPMMRLVGLDGGRRSRQARRSSLWAG